MASTYFSKDTIKFLKELSKNNNRSWFNDNKQRYENFVRTPSLAFIEDIGQELPKLSPHFRVIPKKIGGSLMRIYRDIRFSKDKTPYKTNIGINIRHVTATDMHGPCYYFHVEENRCFAGCGIWRPDSKRLRKIRECIDENPRTWLKAINDKKYKQQFTIGGSTLTNPPRGFSKDHELITDLKRKDFVASYDFDHDLLLSPDLLEQTIQSYAKASPFMRYLCYAVELPFD